MNGRQASDHYAQHAERAQHLLTRKGQLQDKVEQSLTDVTAQLNTALLALAGAYLPTLNAPALDRAERLTGYRGFTKRPPLKALAHEQEVLRRTIARVLADQRYQRREWLVGEHGELTRGVAEARSLLDPWQRECDRYEQQEGFTELLELNYDTPMFEERFWQPGYWKHWAQGDAICEALGVEDFGDDVLPKWQEISAEREKWRGQVADAQRKVDVVHDLVRTHDHALARLPRLPAEMLDACQLQLVRHLEHADPGLLSTWLQDDPDRPALLQLRRVAGLAAKTAFLQELTQQGLNALHMDLMNRRTKYANKAIKFQRSKYAGTAIPESYLDQKFEAKSIKLQERLDKTDALVDRLVAYDNYEHFELENDTALWWMEMTRKRPSRLTPRLRAWYDRNPTAVPDLDDDAAQADAARAVAAAASARNTTDLGYLS
jgi:hypothetical protein